MKVESSTRTARWEKPSCKCKTWIEHWAKNTSEKYPSVCPGCGKEVSNVSDWDGAHVRRVDSSDKTYYITPLCSSCNSKSELEFDVESEYLVKASADSCKVK